MTNGVYQSGARAVYPGMTNRVAVTKPLTVLSVNGPDGTVIDGHRAMRCAYLTNGAMLVGFTLTNGATQSYTPSQPVFHTQRGGGAWCESTSAVLSNCVISGNSTSAGAIRYCNDGGGSVNWDCPGYRGGGAYSKGRCTTASWITTRADLAAALASARLIIASFLETRLTAAGERGPAR